MARPALDFGNRSWEQARGTIFNTLRGHDNDIEVLRGDVDEVQRTLSEYTGYGKASAFWGRLTFAVTTIGLTVIGFLVANHK